MSAIAAPYGLRPVGLIGGRSFVGSERLIKIASGYSPVGGLGQFDVVKYSAGTIVKDTGTSSLTPVGIFGGAAYTDANKQPSYHHFWPVGGVVTSDALAYVYDDPDLVMQAQADGTLAQTSIGLNIGVNNTFGITATAVSGSPTATVTASGNSYTVLTQGIFPGMSITGTGAPAAPNNQVIAVTATTITLNGNATASASESWTVQGMNSFGNSMLSLNAANVGTTNTLPLKIIDFVRGPTSAIGDAFTDVLVIWNLNMHLYRTALGTS
jgi:hypothetical protein